MSTNNNNNKGPKSNNNRKKTIIISLLGVAGVVGVMGVILLSIQVLTPESSSSVLERYLKAQADLRANKLTVLEYCDMGFTYGNVEELCNKYKDEHGIK